MISLIGRDIRQVSCLPSDECSEGEWSEDADREQEVERVWQDALAQSPGLFNGRLLTLRRVEQEADGLLVFAGQTDYRTFLAFRSGVDVGEEVRPLAVSGVVRFRDGSVLLARRAKHMTQYPGYFECVPSGGIDDRSVRPTGEVDYLHALGCELEEETGITARDVLDISRGRLLYDEAEGTYDICCLVKVGAEKETVLERMAALDEYSESMLMAQADLAQWASTTEEPVVPVSLALLTMLAQEGTI